MNICGLGHVAIEAKDKEKTLDFYQNILGFERITDNECDKGDAANYFLKNGVVVVEILMQPSRPVRPWGTINHLSLLVEDVDKAIEELKAKGVEFETEEPIFDPYLYERGERFIMLKGPNGERIQLEQIL